MTFATVWGEERILLRCPYCRRIACNEHPRVEPRIVPVRSMQQAKDAQTIIQCRGCRAELEVVRANSA